MSPVTSIHSCQVLVGFLLPGHARANIVAVMLCNTITSQVCGGSGGRDDGQAEDWGLGLTRLARAYVMAIGVSMNVSVYIFCHLGLHARPQTLTILGDYKTALFLRVKPWKMFVAQVGVSGAGDIDIGYNTITHVHTCPTVDRHQHRCDDFGWHVLRRS